MAGPLACSSFMLGWRGGRCGENQSIKCDFLIIAETWWRCDKRDTEI
jgi:hypothetical protein